MKVSPTVFPWGLGSGALSWFRQARQRGSRWAVFGCGDTAYVPKLLVALASVRACNPGVPLFAFAPLFSDLDRVAAARAGIHLGEFRVGELFRAEPLFEGHRWNSVSFFHLAGWRLLRACGFDSSISIDGDVLCCGPLPLEDFDFRGKAFAAVCNGMVGHHFRPSTDLRFLFDALKITSGGLAQKSANTGIMLWNHPVLHQIRFDRQVRQLAAMAGGRGVLPSDQHLVALAIGLGLVEPLWLDTKWNCCRGWETGAGRRRLIPATAHPDSLIRNPQEVYFLHFFKPWERLSGAGSPEASPESEACFRRAYRMWAALAQSAYGEDWLQVFGGGHAQEPRQLQEESRNHGAIRGWLRCLRAAAAILPAVWKREGRSLLEYWERRLPGDLSVSVLQSVVPALSPENLVRRAAASQPYCS